MTIYCLFYAQPMTAAQLIGAFDTKEYAIQAKRVCIQLAKEYLDDWQKIRFITLDDLQKKIQKLNRKKKYKKLVKAVNCFDEKLGTNLRIVAAKMNYCDMLSSCDSNEESVLQGPHGPVYIEP